MGLKPLLGLLLFRWLKPTVKKTQSQGFRLFPEFQLFAFSTVNGAKAPFGIAPVPLVKTNGKTNPKPRF